MKDIDWIKKYIEPKLVDYDVEYKFSEIHHSHIWRFFSGIIEGEIIFWEITGCCNIYMYDYIKEQELINVSLQPFQLQEIDDAINTLLELL